MSTIILVFAWYYPSSQSPFRLGPGRCRWSLFVDSLLSRFVGVLAVSSWLRVSARSSELPELRSESGFALRLCCFVFEGGHTQDVQMNKMASVLWCLEAFMLSIVAGAPIEA